MCVFTLVVFVVAAAVAYYHYYYSDFLPFDCCSIKCFVCMCMRFQDECWLHVFELHLIMLCARTCALQNHHRNFCQIHSECIDDTFFLPREKKSIQFIINQQLKLYKYVVKLNYDTQHINTHIIILIDMNSIPRVHNIDKRGKNFLT